MLGKEKAAKRQACAILPNFSLYLCSQFMPYGKYEPINWKWLTSQLRWKLTYFSSFEECLRDGKNTVSIGDLMCDNMSFANFFGYQSLHLYFHLPKRSSVKIGWENSAVTALVPLLSVISPLHWSHFCKQQNKEHFKTKPTLKLINSHNRRISRKDSVSDIFRKIMQSKHPQNVLRTQTFRNKNQ